jgi:hypothetical protein
MEQRFGDHILPETYRTNLQFAKQVNKESLHEYAIFSASICLISHFLPTLILQHSCQDTILIASCIVDGFCNGQEKLTKLVSNINSRLNQRPDQWTSPNQKSYQGKENYLQKNSSKTMVCYLIASCIVDGFCISTS